MTRWLAIRATVLPSLQTAISAFQEDAPVVQSVMQASLQPHYGVGQFQTARI
jgi:hypothetical protein